jgi:hypothetical protein
MAWDESEFCGQLIVVGDKVIDEFSFALTKISVEYIDRYGRKPTVAEIMYAFKVVMLSNSNEYFSDPINLTNAHISVEKEKM